MFEDNDEAVEIADRARWIMIIIITVHGAIASVIAYDGGGLRGELRQHLRDLHDADQVTSLRRPRFERVGIEHLHTAGAGIKMHVVAAVVNRFLSLTAVEIEVPR